MVSAIDGPASAAFRPVPIAGNVSVAGLRESSEHSEPMRIALDRAPDGA
jgi:hypothetical protein